MPAFSLDLGLERGAGLTHVIDKGLGPRAWEDVLEIGGRRTSTSSSSAGARRT